MQDSVIVVLDIYTDLIYILKEYKVTIIRLCHRIKVCNKSNNKSLK